MDASGFVVLSFQRPVLLRNADYSTTLGAAFLTFFDRMLSR
jgi:hypothetical protein